MQSICASYENVISEKNCENIQTFYAIKSSLYRHRDRLLPKIPRSIRSISISGQWSQTLDRKRFSLKIDRNWGIIVFSTEWQLQLLAISEILLSDGTFKSSPKLFFQLYIIHGVIEEKKFPLVWVLLKNKTTGIYRRMLEVLRRQLRKRNKNLPVKEIICDFELGFKNAVETDFPQVRIRGCYFHFTKALLKRIKEIGLFNSYRDDPLLNAFLRKIMAVGFLPVFFVRRKYYELLQTTNVRFLKNCYPQVALFLQYFENTWLNLFPPNLYNVYSRPLTLRTINACEGYNNRINTRLGKRVKPNFWLFLRTLQKEEKWAKTCFEQYKMGYASKPQRKKWRDLNSQIQNLKNRFESRIITLDQYWTNMSHVCQNVK